MLDVPSGVVVIGFGCFDLNCSWCFWSVSFLIFVSVIKQEHDWSVGLTRLTVVPVMSFINTTGRMRRAGKFPLP
jgi:hypothetical protein